jgi:hypothetical protein
MFGNAKTTDLVLADAGVATFQSLLGAEISIQQYQQGQWLSLAGQITDPGKREMAKMSMAHHWTPFVDAVSTRNLVAAAARNALSLEVVYARSFSPRHLENNNVILEGNRRANPWMALFEDRLDFPYGYDIKNDFGYFRNARPRAGEDTIYRVLWDRRGYCRVAYVPNLSHTGTVLILAGTDLSSAEAGARFVTSPDWVTRLRQSLGLRTNSRLPYFEALLRTDLVVASVPRFDIVAVRGHPQ